nr:HAD hydrolase-like protein [uncultured Lichenicoccus sp.]
MTATRNDQHPTPEHPSRQAVLLDLDGTLIASRDGIIACLRRALGELGHTIDAAADLDWVVGPPLPDIMARLLSAFGDDRVEAAVLAYRRNYEASGMLDSPLFDGVAEFMQALTASGRRILLATSKPEQLARRILGMRGLTGHFHGFYGARPDDSGAEKPELIGRLIEAEAIDPAHSVMVGDRRFDVSGAHANDMRAVGALWGYGGREELEEAGADGLADSPHTLLAEIERQLANAGQHHRRGRATREQSP